MPFVVQIVDGVFDHGGISPIILREDEDESRVFLDLEAPGTGMRLGVFGVGGDLRGDVGFVEEGELPGCKVDYVEIGWSV